MIFFPSYHTIVIVMIIIIFFLSITSYDCDDYCLFFFITSYDRDYLLFFFITSYDRDSYFLLSHPTIVIMISSFFFITSYDRDYLLLFFITSYDRDYLLFWFFQFSTIIWIWIIDRSITTDGLWILGRRCVVAVYIIRHTIIFTASIIVVGPCLCPTS